jgi:hypothetical protein
VVGTAGGNNDDIFGWLIPHKEPIKTHLLVPRFQNHSIEACPLYQTVNWYSSRFQGLHHFPDKDRPKSRSTTVDGWVDDLIHPDPSRVENLD